MCKVLMMVGVDNPANAKLFMEKAKSPMSIADRDGIGYAITKSNGSFFSERWHKNDHFLSNDKSITPSIREILKPYESRLPFNALDVNHSSVGDIDFNDIKSVLMHTRMATCGRSFENTHPFIIDDNILIHNGVIRNSHRLTNKISTCDSETALNEYLSIGVNTDTAKVQEWLDQLEGYWAFGIFSTDANGNRILDVVRSGASLYFCVIPEIGSNSLVIATTRTILEDSAKACGFTLDSKDVFFLAENHFHRFNAVTGEILEDFKVKESVLNKVVPSYYSNWKGSSGAQGWSGNSSTKTTEKYSNKYSNRHKKTNPKKTLGDYYGFDESLHSDFEMGEEDEVLLLEMCSDVTEPLIDMLYMYDESMGTSYGIEYESLDPSQQRFFDASFQDKTMPFIDVIDALDEYWTSSDKKKELM